MNTTTKSSSSYDNHHQKDSEKKIPKQPSVEQVNPQKEKETVTKTEPMVQMGDGLPALPPKPSAPQRQALPSASTISHVMRQRVPNVNQASKPQINIPAGSDLGVVGKLGAYQVAHLTPVSAAVDVHSNILFWFYAITLFTTFIIMKRRN